MPDKKEKTRTRETALNRPRDLVKLRSYRKTAKFRLERRLRVSAKYLIRLSGISPRPRLVPAGPSPARTQLV